MFFWNPYTGKNRLARNVGGIPTVVTNSVATSALNSRDFEQMVAVDLDPAVAGSELFFWSPVTGKNRLVLSAGGVPAYVMNMISASQISNRRFSQVLPGDFNPADDGEELLFWNLSSGASLLVP